ncbi:MAG: PhzF family phenazine biosynthesis protein [Bacillota bacterium]
MEVPIVNAFTWAGRGGNPAGVVLDAPWLRAPDMQGIAAELGLSETAFLVQTAGDAYRARYFTPAVEVGLCGHATIAAFHLLAVGGRLTQGQAWADTGAGRLRVRVSGPAAAPIVMLEMPQPRFGAPLAQAELPGLASLLGCPPDWLRLPGQDAPAQAVWSGLWDLIVPVAGLTQLLALNPDHTQLARYCLERGLTAVHAFTLETAEPGHTAHARDFAPAAGIPEESATGTASAALGSYLVAHGLAPASARFLFEQGHYLKLPSLICVEAAEQGVSVGGAAAVMARRSVRAPSPRGRERPRRAEV